MPLTKDLFLTSPVRRLQNLKIKAKFNLKNPEYA